ncbi:MAG: tetratricopeptide repeat protein [Chloroflexi bacterium]|nr:tetratricopeptide repeat protein [Chloroflexota bacterium]
MSLSISQTIQKANELFDDRRPDEAREVLEKLLDEEPGNLEAILLLGEVYDTIGWLKEAVEQYEKAYEIMPDDREVLYLLSEACLMNYLTLRSREIAGKGRELFPDDFRFPMVIADSYLWGLPVEGKEGKEAEEYIEGSGDAIDECFRLNPSNGEPYVIKAELALLKNDKRSALDFFEKALEGGLELYSDQVDISLCQSILAFDIGDMDMGRKYLERCLRLVDGWEEPHFLKLMLFREHALMLREHFLGKPITPDEITSFIPAYEQLADRGFKMQKISREVRDFFIHLPEYRSRKQAEGIEKLKGILDTFSGKLPLCIIFQSIKKPSLNFLLNTYLKELESGE